MMRKNKLLIALLIGVAATFGPISCTYDYFVDETNYMISVPDNLSDCRILIYNRDSLRTGSIKPYTQSTQVKNGVVKFRLPPGIYSVYFYAHVDSLSFTDEDNLNNAAFSLKSVSPGTRSAGTPEEDFYVSPSDVLFDKFETEIKNSGSVRHDRVDPLEYTGFLKVRFVNFHLPEEVRRVELIARNVGVKQYLKYDTITDSRTAGIIRYSSNELSPLEHSELNPMEDEVDAVEVIHRFLPSEGMRLEYTFKDGFDSLRARVLLGPINHITGQLLKVSPGDTCTISIRPNIDVTLVGPNHWNDNIVAGPEINLQ